MTLIYKWAFPLFRLFVRKRVLFSSWILIKSFLKTCFTIFLMVYAHLCTNSYLCCLTLFEYNCSMCLHMVTTSIVSIKSTTVPINVFTEPYYKNLFTKTKWTPWVIFNLKWSFLGKTSRTKNSIEPSALAKNNSLITFVQYEETPKRK